MNGSSSDDVERSQRPRHVSSDTGTFAIIPLWIVQRLNEGTSTGPALSVLAALHQWIDSDRYGYPSHASIAKRAGLSVASVKRGIKALEAIGALVIVPRWIDAEGNPTSDRPTHVSNPERTSNGYFVRYADPSPEPRLGQNRPHPLGQNRPHGWGQNRPSNHTQLEPDPSKPELSLLNSTTHEALTSIERARAQSQTPNDFDEFWRLYPRKVSKAKCEQRWRRMTSEQRRLAIESLPGHIAHWERTVSDPRFIPHPTTWLNGERWNDRHDAEIALAPEPGRSAPGMTMIRNLGAAIAEREARIAAIGSGDDEILDAEVLDA